MDKRFEGKTAIVTGGASGLGAACCRRFAQEGASVGILDVNSEMSQALAQEIADTGGEAVALHADVTSPESMARAITQITDRYGRLDAAVNNAGIGGNNEALEDITADFWNRTIAINLSGVFYAMQAEFPAMAQSGGAIVNMASILGVVGFDDAAPYVAAKHGVIGLTKCAALSWAAQNIRVTAVCPAFVRTPLAEKLPEDVWPAILAKHPLARLPTPEDVAAMVCFLASDEARNITGSAHLVDAGYTAQ